MKCVICEGDEDAGAALKGGSTVFRAGGGSGGASVSQQGSTSSAGDELMHETVAKQIKAVRRLPSMPDPSIAWSIFNISLYSPPCIALL